MKWELTRDKYMTRDEVKKLRTAAEDRANADLAKGRVSGVRAWAVIDFASQTGLRVGELVAVTIGDLELSGKTPCVWVVGGKGRDKDEREPVSLNKQLVKHLRQWLKFKDRIDEDTSPEAHLFISKRGGAYSTRALQKLFKVALADASLPALYSIHALRHSWGTYLYERTKDLRLVQKELRHRSPTTTAVYAHVTPEARAEAVNGVYDD